MSTTHNASRTQDAATQGLTGTPSRSRTRVPRATNLHLVADEIIELQGDTVLIHGVMKLLAPTAAAELSELNGDERVDALGRFVELGAQVYRDRTITAVDHLLDRRVSELTDRVSAEIVERMERTEGDGLTRLTGEVRHTINEAVALIVGEIARQNARATDTPRAGGLYQEVVAEELQRLSVSCGDAVSFCGNDPGPDGRAKQGDALMTVSKTATLGIEDVRIVFEMKHGATRFSARRIEAELDAACRNRGARVGVFIAPSIATLPNQLSFHELTPQRLAVAYDPYHDSPTILAMVVRLARNAAIEAAGAGITKGQRNHILQETAHLREALMTLGVLRTCHKKAGTALSQAEEFIDKFARSTGDHLNALERAAVEETA